MATFHFTIKSGRYGVDHALYITRQGFYADRDDLIASGHGNLPAWARDEPTRFWKAAEAHERKNGAVYREAVIALPNEFNKDQNVELTKDLVNKLVLGKPHQFAIHLQISSLEGVPNPHLHLMWSDRLDDGIERPAETFFSRYRKECPEAGGRKKDSGGRNSMQLRDDCIARRELVEDTINEHLALHGHDARVDCRTLKARGLSGRSEPRLAAFRIKKMSEVEKAAYVEKRRTAKEPK